MSREQMERDFSELYVGQNPKELAREYEKKKKKEMFLLFLAAIFIIGLCVFNDWQESRLEEDNKITRGEYGSGKQEVSLQMKTKEGTWQDIDLIVHPKEYSKHELEELFSVACESLPDIIRKENESLEQVSTELDLITQIEEFPFSLTWESSREEILNAVGELKVPDKNLEEDIELTVTFQYEDWEREYSIPVHVTVQANNDFSYYVERSLKEQEEKTRQDEQFALPDTFQDEVMRWRYPPGNSAVVLGSLFFIMLPFISGQKDREIHNQTKLRKEQLQDSFPEFISKLILLLETGMSIRGAVFQIAGDYQKKSSNRKNYLSEELQYICRQMKNGLAEKEAYELLGKRCNLTGYKKLSGLLVQHLQKGGSSILETLRKEAEKETEERRRQLQKKGEEMGTKLLFPMIIMLGIVMVFIMVPALFSFQM